MRIIINYISSNTFFLSEKEKVWGRHCVCNMLQLLTVGKHLYWDQEEKGLGSQNMHSLAKPKYLRFV